jgi:tRNA A37 methylthiotransferase MiaB
MSITSDIIVGFPETSNDFEETVKLVAEAADGLYIKYSERRGTPAANLALMTCREEKSERFMKFAESVQRERQKQIYEGYVGRELSVLVERRVRNPQRHDWPSTCHKVVNFPGSDSMPGTIVQVRSPRRNKMVSMEK